MSVPRPSRYVIGNWKMHTGLEDAEALLAAIDAGGAEVQVGIAPPYPWIVPLRDERTDSAIWIGAQHAVPEPEGAFTGDISVAMLAAHVDFILIGHSEQRHNHPETKADYAAAIRATLAADRVAILCVGEDQAQRESGNAIATVEAQLAAALPAPLPGTLLIAYEPVWAIGTGLAATAEDAEIIASALATWCERHIGRTVPILYGGSVRPDNDSEFITDPHVHGLLVGGASLHADEFNAIVTAAGQ